jgi:hypothetical protein
MVRGEGGAGKFLSLINQFFPAWNGCFVITLRHKTHNQIDCFPFLLLFWSTVNLVLFSIISWVQLYHFYTAPLPVHPPPPKKTKKLWGDNEDGKTFILTPIYSYGIPLIFKDIIHR